MFLSVLIPTYDYRCYTLVENLHEQLEACGKDYEVIVMDDGGRDQVVNIANLKINDLTHCRYIHNKINVGRSAIRNNLIKEAKGDWCLFMDSDGIVIRKDFIEKYIEASCHQYNVICGGIVHSDKCPSKEQSLRWKYEKSYERKLENKGGPFRSFCFLIKKDVFRKVHFDERYKLYGNEDMQFGIDLKNEGYKILYIDNPLMNGDIENNTVFLRKTEEALLSLKCFENNLKEESTLLRLINKLKKCHILFITKLFLTPMLPIFKSNLVGEKPSLIAFNLYKLGFYLK